MLFNQRLVTVPIDPASLSQRNHALAVLLELSNFLASCTDLEPLLQGSLELIMKQFGVGAGRVYLGEPDENYFQLVTNIGLDPSGLETVKTSNGFTGKAARSRSFLAMRVSDLDNEDRAELLAGKGLEVIICLPLLTRGQVIGVMNLGADHLIDLKQETVDLSMVMGNLVATSVESVMQARELSDQARLLAEQKEAVQFFAYTACHDMKSPATGVHGLARMLLRKCAGDLDQQGKEIVGQIERAAGRIEALAQEINAYIKAKEAPLALEDVPLAEIKQSVESGIAGHPERQRVELQWPDGDIIVKADRMALERAFTNLIENAFKYAGPELSLVQITYRQKGRYHVFCVSDDGVGVSPDLADKVFTLFKRAPTSQGTEGTGLGLAIVKEIARRHGGSAWLDTGRQKGASFCFSLASDI